jgi:hypothetical protein
LIDRERETRAIIIINGRGKQLENNKRLTVELCIGSTEMDGTDDTRINKHAAERERERERERAIT